MRFSLRKWLVLGGIVAAVLGADQGTKRWASAALARPVKGHFPPRCNPEGPVAERELLEASKEIDVVDGFFELRYSENCGGAFSILHQQKQSLRRPFFYAAYLLSGLLLMYFFVKLRENEKVLLLAFSAILGGAIGNAIDRIARSYVVDFVYWHWRDAASWPIFNIADVGITVGLALILLDTFFLAPARERKARVVQNAAPNG